MIYSTPSLTAVLEERLAELDGLRAKLRADVVNPDPWLGTLRRLVKAASVESSVSIEGFEVPEGEAAAIVETGEADPGDQNELAVACYARAMDHVGVMALDPALPLERPSHPRSAFRRLLLPTRQEPRPMANGPIGVTGGNGRIIYQAPDADEVRPLMGEIVGWLESGDLGAHVVVRAAMAHLHVVSVHPFRDGNGRISRITQSLVLAREGLLSSEFASIEEYLGAHTPDYYNALQQAYKAAAINQNATPPSGSASASTRTSRKPAGVSSRSKRRPPAGRPRANRRRARLARPVRDRARAEP